LAINRAHQINQKKKRKRKDVPQTQLIDWKTLNQPSIINVGMGSERKKKESCNTCVMRAFRNLAIIHLAIIR
jgi:hypothetical protein